MEVESTMDEVDLMAEKKASHEEIKGYVLGKFGLKVSNLYIAQVKRMCGIIERENYNWPKSEGARGSVDFCYAPTGAETKTARQPKCPKKLEMPSQLL